MKVLMFGWEFPPFYAGGVGTVCYELTKKLSSKGIAVDYVMPQFPSDSLHGFLNIISANDVIDSEELSSTEFNINRVPSLLAAYQTPEEYQETLEMIQKTSFGNVHHDNTGVIYGDDLLGEIDRFATRVGLLIQQGKLGGFDIIHAHDWTTAKAAVVAKRLTGKPLIVHVHITEVNKNSGLGVNPEVYSAEREGFMAADSLVAVSNGIKQTLIDHYGIPAEKILVIHNAKIELDTRPHPGVAEFKGDNKVVSYLGRVTGMKGPDNFIEMAAKVIPFCPKTKFVMAGSGDRLQPCIDRAKELGIYDHFYFHGFYNREEADLFFSASDVFVLPSVMEPFGVTPIEAMTKNTPTIITKQSGVSEVLDHCFKCDFWDVDKMASQVIALLKYSKLHGNMREKGFVEAHGLTWDKPADECIALYNQLS